jgi:hypothetical protein
VGGDRASAGEQIGAQRTDNGVPTQAEAGHAGVAAGTGKRKEEREKTKKLQHRLVLYVEYVFFNVCGPI